MNLLESEGFPSLLRTGRWALALIETGISLFLAYWFPQRPPAAWVAMCLLFLYNAVVLIELHRRPLSRLPVRLLLVLDLIFLGNIAYYTGGASSPFLGQGYLIVFVAALFFNMAGGLLAGVGAAGIAIALGFAEPSPSDWEIVRDTAPYFVIVGGFTGFLVQQMKLWFARYQEQRSWERDRQRDEEARIRERELAREVQRSALPTAAPPVAGVEVAFRTLPSQEVGGDLYAFVGDPSGQRLGVAVGDVSGKGMAAALIATSIGYLLPYLSPLSAPHAALLRLNKDLCERLPEAAFATLIYSELAPDTGSVQLWNAGHPPALLWRSREGRVITCASGHAPPLGLFSSWRAPVQTLEFLPGDLLLLYSDGVLEARSEQGEEFGLERLAAVLAERAPQGAEKVVEGVQTAVLTFGIARDDITIVACQRLLAYPGI